MTNVKMQYNFNFNTQESTKIQTVSPSEIEEIQCEAMYSDGTTKILTLKKPERKISGRFVNENN